MGCMGSAWAPHTSPWCTCWPTCTAEGHAHPPYTPYVLGGAMPWDRESRRELLHLPHVSANVPMAML